MKLKSQCMKEVLYLQSYTGFYYLNQEIRLSLFMANHKSKLRNLLRCNSLFCKKLQRQIFKFEFLNLPASRQRELINKEYELRNLMS